MRLLLGPARASRWDRGRPHLPGHLRPARNRQVIPVATERHAFAYVFAGDGHFTEASEPRLVRTDTVLGDDIDDEPPYSAIGDRSLVLFDRGDEVVVRAGEHGIRFLLVSGRPIKEPVAWYGPVVMNTREEIATAISQLNNGTFLNG